MPSETTITLKLTDLAKKPYWEKTREVRAATSSFQVQEILENAMVEVGFDYELWGFAAFCDIEKLCNALQMKRLGTLLAIGRTEMEHFNCKDTL